MTIELNQLLGKAKDVLDLMGVKGYSNIRLTYVTKAINVWRVNFSYEITLLYAITKIGCFTVDVTSGEIQGMWLDRAFQ